LNRERRRQRRVKRRQFKHQKGLCCWCNERMAISDEVPNEHPRKASWEHVIPKSQGGGSRLENLVLAHRKCNLDRGVEVRVPLYSSYKLAATKQKKLTVLNS